jgi:hypothetical protein
LLYVANHLERCVQLVPSSVDFVEEVLDYMAAYGSA